MFLYIYEAKRDDIFKWCKEDFLFNKITLEIDTFL